MPITNFSEYTTFLSQRRNADFQMSAAVTRISRLAAAWPLFLPAPATPTTSVALDRDSAHSIAPIPTVGSGRLSVLGGRFASTGINGSIVILADIMNVSGGLSGAVTTAQTTNLPTAALTRNTNGVGVMAGLIIYTQLGGTATTFSVSYTNQSNVSGQISPLNQIGGAGFREVNSIIPIPLLAGDTGVRSIESVTLTATTGVANNFGVVLFKPISMMFLDGFDNATHIDAVSTGRFSGQLAEVTPNSCLSLILGCPDTGQQLVGTINLAEV